MIEIKNLTKTFDNLLVFKDFNLKLPLNKTICFLGPSGCGKTTLFNIVAKLEPYDKGEIIWSEELDFSYIFQDTRLLPWYTALENIEFVLKSIYSNKEANDLAKYFLDLVKLGDYGNYYPKELSGGMKQRIALARAFAYPSNFLFMDEPFKGLDLDLKKSLINDFLHLLKENPKTVWIVTHDLEEARKIADIIVVLKEKPMEVIEMEILDEK